MKNIYALLICCFTLATSLTAQQQPQSSLFMFNQQIVNPAVVGSRGMPSISAQARQQWSGWEGAPATQFLYFDTPIAGDRVGLGIAFQNQTLGIQNNWATQMAYSYNLPVTEKLNVRIGIHGMVRYYGFDFSDPSIVVHDDGDNSIRNGLTTRQYTGNVGTGLYVEYDDQVFFGVSAPQLYPNTLGFNNDVVQTAKESTHLYAYGGALLPFSDKFSFKPTFMVKYVKGAPFDAELNFAGVYMDKVMAGVGYRLGGNNTGDALTGTMMYQVSPKFAIGGAYDYTLSSIGNFTNGSYELLLRYDFKSQRSDLENPRFFK